MCRRRNVGHVLISTSAYELYASRLRKEHRTKGIRSATCHGVPLHPLPWLPQEMVITFGGKPDRKAKVILAGLRAENNEFVEKLVTSLVEEGYAHMRVTRLPHEPES